MDISTSATTNGLTNRLHGRQAARAWVMDGHGAAERRPGRAVQEPKGTILPLGGMDSGHKGYGLSLLVEALTGGLAGHGRADPKEGWGATVFLQVLDPRAFAGLDAFERQTGEVARQCRASRPAREGTAVRTPGEKGIRWRQAQRNRRGAATRAILPALASWARGRSSGDGTPVPRTEKETFSAANLRLGSGQPAPPAPSSSPAGMNHTSSVTTASVAAIGR
jgi:LDH2 family malate/lactate/ureidoglycolate dehydrogenase